MLKYLALILFLFVGSVCAGEIVDSTEIIDSTNTSQSADSTFSDTLLFDTTGIDVDTLTAAQKAYQLFLSRQSKRKALQQEEEKKEVKVYLSFYDSLVTAFLHPRLNSASEITRSFTKDAGDYFRVDPSYFVSDFQQTPSRKTVRPFGLSGNRLNIVANGLVLSPFEHVPQPDGLIDFNDISTGLAKDIYILPGSAGQLFGGTQSIATLVTVPNQPDNYEPEILLHVDKGPEDYAYTRGGYTKLFTDGKEVDLAVDYRNTTGIRSNTDDNSYNYTGRTLIPFNSSYYLTASGSTYRRKGSYKTSLGIYSPYIERNRTDRNGQIAIEKLNNAQTVKYHLGYGYLKQNSNIDVAYKGRFNFFGHSFNFTRESVLGNKLFKSEISYSYLEQTDGFDQDSEKSGNASFSMFQKKEFSTYGITAGTIYNEEFKFLPFTSLLYQKYSDRYFMMFSVGYSEKAPSMHDMNLKLQTAVLDTGAIGYADVGNKYLLSEKQLVSSFMYEYGSLKNSIRFTVTGGLINDGIDWYHTDTVIELISSKLFSPKISDIKFADFQLKQKLSLNDFLNLSLGGAYHFIEYDIVSSRAFQPDYQLFMGGELHYYWKQKWMDLYAYGETVYAGAYTGYSGEELGNNIVVNTGMAFKIKQFRFYYIFQNSIDLKISNPDAFTNLGQFSYYGFTWNFIN